MERRGGVSLNKEVEWRQWFSGTQGGEALNGTQKGGDDAGKKYNGDNGLMERRGGEV